MIAMLERQAVGHATCYVVLFLFALFWWHRAKMAEINSAYWKAMAKNHARHALTMRTMLDAWYFKRDRQVVKESIPGLTVDEMQEIVDDVYRDAKRLSQPPMVN